MAMSVMVASLAGCDTKSVAVHRPTNQTADHAVTNLWEQDIRRVARDGDWILSRSYFLVGDVISAASPGEDLSHASIYDAKSNTVIEAIGDGIREIPLHKLLDRNHYVIVVRPANMTASDQHDAVLRARTKVGQPFDIGGMFGIDNPDQYYCSELVYWASQTAARTGSHERVVTPADLMKYGEVIYWSGKRDDAQVMQAAMSTSAK